MPVTLENIREALEQFEQYDARELAVLRERPEQLMKIKPLEWLHVLRTVLEHDLPTQEQLAPISSFFTSVGESLALAQQHLRQASAEYRRSAPPYPAEFTIPKVKAALNFDVELAGDKTIRALFYRQSNEAKAREHHSVSFELTAVPAPLRPLASLAPRPLASFERERIAACLEAFTGPHVAFDDSVEGRVRLYTLDLRSERWASTCWCLPTGPEVYTLLSPFERLTRSDRGVTVNQAFVILVPTSLDPTKIEARTVRVPQPLSVLLGEWMAKAQPWRQPTWALSDLIKDQGNGQPPGQLGWSIADGLEDILLACGLDLASKDVRGRLSELFIDVANGVISAQRELDERAASRHRDAIAMPLSFRIPSAHASFEFAVQRMRSRTLELLVYRSKNTEQTSSQQSIEFDIVSNQPSPYPPVERPAIDLTISTDVELREQLLERLDAHVLEGDEFASTRRLHEALDANAPMFAVPGQHIVLASRVDGEQLHVASMHAPHDADGHEPPKLLIDDNPLNKFWRPLVEHWLAPPRA